jgi:hypothetical protein
VRVSGNFTHYGRDTISRPFFMNVKPVIINFLNPLNHLFVGVIIKKGFALPA